MDDFLFSQFFFFPSSNHLFKMKNDSIDHGNDEKRYFANC